MLFLLIFTCFSANFLEFAAADHITVTYRFWEKDPQIVEKAEFFTKFFANSNRFFTSNLVFEQHDQKMDKIAIRSDSWKGGAVEDPVIGNLDRFFVSIFQKFSQSMYTNLALDSLPVFDPSIFRVHHYAYQNYDMPPIDNIWVTPDPYEHPNQKASYILLYRKSSFEHWEAVLSFVNALKRTHMLGFIVDCDEPSSSGSGEEDYIGVDEEEIFKKKEVLCAFNSRFDQPMALALQDDGVYHIYKENSYEKNAVRDWMLKIQQDEVTLLNEHIVPAYRSGMVPGYEEPEDTVIMLFVDSKKSMVWKNYYNFAKKNYGKYHLTALISKDVRQWSTYPAFITMKPYDDHVKAFTFHKNLTYDRMEQYIEDSIHPSVHKIEMPSEFLFATSTEKPLVVFFDPLQEANLTNFKYFAAQEMGINRKFHYAAISGMDIFGMYISSIFKVESGPHYVLIYKNEKSWCIHTRPIENADFQQMKNWIKTLPREYCQEEIENYKVPIGRLHLLERHEDVKELEDEMTQIQRDRTEL